MRVAIECAGFTAGEADKLRRSMATFKFTGGVSHFKDKLVKGMVARGYAPAFAEAQKGMRINRQKWWTVMATAGRKERLSPPLMYAFRTAHEARDAKKKIDLRDESG